MAQRTTSKAAPLQIKPAALRTFHARLARWYEAHGRHELPWRQTADPYHIWLSEVMLQQTQVATVRDRFYFPFLAKFPTVEALAAAEREAVMKAWEGLGYYSRARNLHEAAKKIVHSEWWIVNSGAKPSKPFTIHDALYTHLLSLPGIGKNTAHAILAFAFHQPVAILEANVKRVVARIYALETPSDAELWAGAKALLNHATPFDYNQAMMDIGSMVCTPKNPNCSACPANSICKGKSSPHSYPTPKAKKQVPTREVTIHVREDGNGRLFLEARDAKLLGGLYGFPQTTVIARSEATWQPRHKGIRAPKTRQAGSPRFARDDAHILGTVTHIYSHFKLIGTVVYEKSSAKTNSADWYSREEIRALPLSTLDHKVLALVENCHSSLKKKIKAQAKHGKR